METLKGASYLQSKLNLVRPKVLAKYDYYEMTNSNTFKSISIPQDIMRAYYSRLGWCTKAVDLLADRLIINRFKNDYYNMQSLFESNNADILFSSAIKGALISACDFVYLYKDEADRVRMQVVGGGNATGIIDDTTGLLKEGYAVLERNPDDDSVITSAYFTPYETVYTSNGVTWSVKNDTGKCLLVPIINDPKQGGDNKFNHQFGHSRISRNMMRTQDQAEELNTRIAIMSDISVIGQKYVSGTSEYTEIDNLRASFSSMLRFDKDEDGDRPTLGQFSQMSFKDHKELLDAYVSLFSGMSSLTRDDLGFVTENPSSAESKKAALESLRVIASKCQHDFATGFINVGLVAACLRDGINYNRDAIKDTQIVWKPLVEPDAATLSSIGDGLIKINQAVPNFFDAVALADLIGIKGAETIAEVDDGGLFDFTLTNT